MRRSLLRERATAMPARRRSELGDFLRSRRERLSPAAVGLTHRDRRRTPGLRREEVAERAGISADWYVRIEQGRTVRPSPTTIDALARALCLDPADSAHLRALARDGDGRAFAEETVPDGIRQLVAGLAPPAYVTGRRWDVLAWNAAAADTLTDFGRLASGNRNLLVHMLTNPDARRLFGAAWADEARRMVAQFRTTYDLWAGDPTFVELVAHLRQDSPEFAPWWETHDVRGVGGGRKLLHHPERGARHYAYASFQANDDPGLKLVIYTPT